MKKLIIPGLLVSLIFGALSCTKKVDTGDFDVDAWKGDAKGCEGVRTELIDDLVAIKPNLLGLYQKSVISVLGDPEEQELYSRSQTYYIYYIDGAEGCPNPTPDPRKLEVRFTALGIANEVNIK